MRKEYLRWGAICSVVAVAFCAGCSDSTTKKTGTTPPPETKTETTKPVASGGKSTVPAAGQESTRLERDKVMSQEKGGAAGLEDEARAIDANLNRYTKVEKELQTGTDGGGTLTAYMDTGKPKLLIASVLLSNRKVTKRFYYKEQQVFHLIETSEEFAHNPETGAVVPGKFRSAHETQYFLSDGKLLGGNEESTAAMGKDAEMGRKITDESVAFTNAAESAQKSVDITGLFKSSG